jgi:hypothetical protein
MQGLLTSAQRCQNGHQVTKTRQRTTCREGNFRLDKLKNERRSAAVEKASGIWENEGRAPGRLGAVSQYGRRIETDRTWTVYHVFTGVPADDAQGAMTGLDRTKATSLMASLNIIRPAKGAVVSMPPRPRMFSTWDFRRWL